MALSPWPTTPAALAKAVTRLRTAVRGAAEGSDERAAQLGAAASAQVEHYAPNAPQAIRDEAVIRLAGYLAQSDFGTIMKEDIGPRSVSYRTDHGRAFKSCGAAGLLAPWRVRRAGAAG